MSKNLSTKEISSLLEIGEIDVEMCIKARKGAMRLSEAVVKEMKLAALAGRSIKEIATIYHISYDAVARYTKKERAQYLEQNPKYKLLSPDGHVYKFNNLKDFCESHNLRYQGVACLLAFERKSYKGWKRVDE